MRDGFVKIAAGTPNIRVADCMYNAEQIVALMKEAAAQGVKVLALPELCITAYTCADLFLQPVLLQSTGVYPQRDQRSGPDRRRRYAHPLPQ